MSRRMSVHLESWTCERPFRITGKTHNEFVVIVCEIRDGEHIGFGEAMGVHYLGETPESIVAEIEGIAGEIEDGISRHELQAVLPAGGARNAVDCALWDLEAKLAQRSVWEMSGCPVKPIHTVFTIGLEDTPEEMALKAAAARSLKLLKVKLDGHRPVDRIKAIRDARPDADIVVDANQAWNFYQLREVAPRLAELGVSMIEQPLPRGHDAELEEYRPPLPLCADESCQDSSELEAAALRYQMINIKLDKAGGMTEALALAEAAKKRGLALLIGCMGGTSLAMAPAHVVAQAGQLADIDGPLLLKHDRVNGLEYRSGIVVANPGSCWGWAAR